MTTHIAIFSTALLLSASTLALAQAPAAKPDTTNPETIKVEASSIAPFAADISISATKSAAALLETPQSISVVSRQLMEQQGAQSVSDVLRYVGGVLPQSAGRRGFDDFIIRGFSQSAYAFRDGLRIDPGFVVEQETFGLERLEIIKGPGSVLYGQVAPGGLINMVSKRPTLNTTTATSVGAELGSFDSSRVTLDHRAALDRQGDIAYRALLLASDRNDAIDSVGASRRYFSPSLALRIAPATSLTLLSLYQQDKFTRAVSLPARGTVLPNANGIIARNLFLGEPGFDGLTVKQWQLGYEFEHRFNDVFKFSQNLRRSEFDFTGQNINPNAVAANGLTVARTPIFLNLQNNVLTVDSQVSAKFKTGTVEHDVLLGVDYLRYRNFQMQRLGTVAPLNLFQPVYGAAVAPLANMSSFRRLVQEQRGVYVQNNLKIANTFVVLAGVRRDSARDDNTNYLNNTRPVVNQSATTGRLGLLYLAPMNFSPYVSFSQSFVPLVANPLRDGSSVAPEEGEQTEVGVKWGQANGAVQATLAYFDLTRRNVVSADPLNTAFSVQVGEQRHKGIELEANLRLAAFVDVVFAYSTLDAVVTQSTTGNQGKRPQNAPKHMASIWTTWRLDKFGARGVDVSIGLRNIASRVGDALNTYDVGGYTVADIGALVKMGAWLFALNAKNISDKNYFIGTTAGTNVSIGERRAIIGSAQFTW
jgi:iron complex outermembrane recepter protein